MRLQKKSYSRINLIDLLRRRRSTLKNFLDETGIVSYELLKIRCESMGVVPPTESEFNEVKGNPLVHSVSSPTEGIIVFEVIPETSSDVQNNLKENNHISPQKKKQKNHLNH